MSSDGNDHTGILVILDAAGRTIAGLERRVEALTAQVEALSIERTQLGHLLAEARASMCDAAHVPPPGPSDADDGAHDPPPPVSDD